MAKNPQNHHTTGLNTIITVYENVIQIFGLRTPVIPVLPACPAGAGQAARVAHAQLLDNGRANVLLFQQMVLNEAENNLKTARPTIKVQRPTFDGKTENTRGFLAGLATYRHLRAGDFSSDETFIAWALACMEGPLVNPWKHALLYRRSNLVAAGTPLPQELTDWGTFVAEFMGKFADTNETENASRTLMGLKQIRSAREFAQEFDRLAEIANLTGQDFLVDHFRRNLKAVVQEKLLRQHFPTLHDLQVSAIEWDDALFQFRKQSRTTEQPKRPPPRPQQPRPQGNGVPMDLDATRLSSEESKKRMEAGLCFACGKPGHVARRCPEGGGKGKGKAPEQKQPWKPIRGTKKKKIVLYLKNSHI
jgi:hypothetical protein